MMHGVKVLEDVIYGKRADRRRTVCKVGKRVIEILEYRVRDQWHRAASNDITPDLD
jgi:hypothetical protein